MIGRQKMKPKKINYWKVATIILAIICTLLFAYDFYENNLNKNFPISEEQMESFVTVLMDSKSNEMRICSLESKECIRIGRGVGE